MTTTLERDQPGDLRDVIERAILEHPRSLQKAIGPSEIGTPCDRKLGYKLAEWPTVQPAQASWRPTVGTAVHAWLAEAFARENAALGWDRWVIEQRVAAGRIDGEPLTGSCDLFDLLTGTVIDWKIVGPASLKAKRAARSPGRAYRVQVHTYALGFEQLGGHAVHNVAVFFLPSAGELGDGYYWTEPYDRMLAVEAINRADGIAAAVRAPGMAEMVLPQLRTAEDFCERCEWWWPGSTDARVACPGENTRTRSANPAAPFGAVKPPKKGTSV